MFNNTNVQSVQHCLDAYLQRIGKVEIDEIEANQELARAGVLADDQKHPGNPLREFLSKLRDSNKLPANVRQLYGFWKIKHSKSIMKMIQILQF